MREVRSRRLANRLQRRTSRRTLKSTAALPIHPLHHGSFDRVLGEIFGWHTLIPKVLLGTAESCVAGGSNLTNPIPSAKKPVHRVFVVTPAVCAGLYLKLGINHLGD
jgi:hypothetical protein